MIELNLPDLVYCERSEDEIWGEPLNAISNIAFFIAAFFSSKFYANPVEDKPALILSILIGIIGLGSLLFHTFANVWTQLADVIPIMAFIGAYFVIVLRRVFKCAYPTIAAAFLILGTASVFIDQLLPFELPNNSNGYLPAIISLIAVTLFAALKQSPASRSLIYGSGLICLAFLFRGIDLTTCSKIPWGTHFLWHIFVASGLLLLVRALYLARPSTRAVY